MRSERGNILLIILIAILLYGMLTFAISNSDDSSTFSTDTEEFKAALGELYNYSNAMQQAVQKLKTINSCGDDDIDFFMSGITSANYQHAANNIRCKVFHPKGGAMNYNNVSDAISPLMEYHFTGMQTIEGIGTSDAELIMLAFVTQDACIQINRHFDITNPSSIPPADSDIATASTQRFNGGNTASGGYDDAETQLLDVAQLLGQRTGCVYDSSDYIFYHVLIPR